MANCTNKFGCTGVSFSEGKYLAHIKLFNKPVLLGKFKLLEDAICARMMANIKYGLKDKRRLINKDVILKAIDKAHKHSRLRLTKQSPYWRLVKEQEIELACMHDPDKDYSSTNSIIDKLGY